MPTLISFRKVLQIEAEAILSFAERTGDVVKDVVECMLTCKGRVVVIGMGKCGHVGKKIAATLASTGTSAIFVHPSEAVHGDLGFIDPDDNVAIILSNSGETMEIRELLPFLRRRNIRIVAMTGRPDSTLARYAKYVLDTRVEREADPIQMAPTTSSTLMLAIGDALACVLMEKRKFGKEDYAHLHPGGTLGQKLLCTVSELMHTGKDIPAVQEDVTLREAIVELTSKRLGSTLALNNDGIMTGILTDGDIRRFLQRDRQPLDMPLRSLMTRLPKTTRADILAVDALQLMEDNLITVLPVVDAQNRPEGIIHIHDILRAGIGQ